MVITQDNWHIDILRAIKPDESLNEFLPHLKGITVVDLSGEKWEDPWPSFALTKAVTDNADNLRSFSGFYIEFGVDDLKILFQNAKTLRELVLLGCKNVTEEVMVLCAQNCKQLERLCNEHPVSQDTAKLLLSSFYRLTKVDIVPTLKCPIVLLPLVKNFEVLEISDSYMLSWCVKQKRPLCYVDIAAPGINNDFFVALFKQNPLLKEISLQSRQLTNSALVALGQCCPLVQKVEMKDWYREKVDVSLLTSLLNLRWLELEYRNVENDRLDKVLSECTNLVKLRLYKCTGYAGELLQMIPTLRPNVLELAVTYNKDLVSRDVIVLLEGCIELRRLDVCGCVNVTSEVLPTLKAHGRVQLDYYDSGIKGEDFESHLDHST